MKIFKAEQIRTIDALTIREEPIASIDLMERAAKACFDFLKNHLNPSEKVLVLCGAGNNGGDGFALARLLNDAGFYCDIVFLKYSDQLSTDTTENRRRFISKFPAQYKEVYDRRELQKFLQNKYSIIVDALIGTGLNKPVSGLLAEAIDLANDQQGVKIISVDIPSGLYADRSSKECEHVIHADLVMSFQYPKVAFLLAENAEAVKDFVILDIGLYPEAIRQQATHWFFITAELITSLIKPRKKFSHKGDHGHALLIAGSKGKSGAAIISAKACMRSGAGRFTLHSTNATLQALLNHLPEAMGSVDENADHVSAMDGLENFDALAFGPGLGLHEETQRLLKKILNYYRGKLVIDADGLNSLAENKTWLSFLPPNTILTPHPKEFERLTQSHETDFERLQTLKEFAIKYHCIVVLKSAHTAIAMPDGNLFFNSSGNAGLAKAGSGDGLTGIILALLSRGYSSPQAALIGTYIHGYAADLCKEEMSMESILISDVITKLATAFKELEAGVE